MSLFQELKRRNVFRVGIAYLVIAWLLVQVADIAFPAFDAPAWVLRVFMLFVMLGFPVALVLAWAFELTPQGLRTDRSSGNAFIYGLAAALVVGALLWYFSARPASDTAQVEAVLVSDIVSENAMPSIAVLPFDNLSREEDNEPFTSGIHGDLLTQLSKIDSLRTISRTSVLRYAETDLSIPEIAAELGVRAILEGGVQRVRDTVRINVQLIDAISDEHIWAETYDRELSAANIFGIQSEIASRIAEKLEAELSTDDQRRLDTVPTDSLEALELYFVGKQLADQRTLPSINEAIRRFEHAIATDPDFALAHAGLAYAWSLLPEYSPTVDRMLARRESEKAAARAMELDPDLPEALIVTAWNHLIHRYDWELAESLFRRALAVQSNNADALHWLSHVLSWQGRHTEAIEIAKQAVASDPYSPLMRMNLSYILMDARDYEGSIRMRDETLELDYSFELWRNMWLTFLRAGRFEEASESLLRWARGTGRDVQAARRLSELLEQREASDDPVEIPDELIEAVGIGSENQAQVYAAAGDAETTLHALRVALHERAGSRSVLSMKINPLYDFVRDDPRFAVLLKEAGLSE